MPFCNIYHFGSVVLLKEGVTGYFLFLAFTAIIIWEDGGKCKGKCDSSEIGTNDCRDIEEYGFFGLLALIGGRDADMMIMWDKFRNVVAVPLSEFVVLQG